MSKKVHEYMTLIDFPERNVIFAKDQPEYRPLPAHAVPKDPSGQIICCWRFSWRARLRLLFFLIGKDLCDWPKFCAELYTKKK